MSTREAIITDEMINAAAREMWNDRDARHGGSWDDRDPREVCVIQTKATARAALTAALAATPADDSVSFIRILGEELCNAGMPAGDRSVILANIRSLISDRATPAVGGEAPLPTYGNLPWDQLGRDVMEANMGTRCDFEFDPKFYPGHQSLSTNFNSLARIVDKYRVAAPPASTLRVTGARDLVEEAACLIWAELCPGMVMGDDDLPHYEAAAKDVLALSSASSLRGREIVALIPRLLERADSYISDNGRDDAYSCNLVNDLASILRRVSASPPEQPAATYQGSALPSTER